VSEVDLGRLAAAAEILSEQRELADSDAVWDLLETAVQAVTRAKQTVELSRLAVAPRITMHRRIEVTDELLGDMLRTGRASWVERLLSWSRYEVELRRRRLGLPAFRPGGSPALMELARAHWEATWVARLKAEGLWPEDVDIRK
jgi:hypothetical protein